MILLFSNALGIVSWGIAAVMTMSLGTAYRFSASRWRYAMRVNGRSACLPG
jgi:ABC-type nickel/cobalt efflux system permease component RcnA